MFLPNRGGSAPNFDDLYAVAIGQAGYFTAAQAKEVGYSLQLLQHHLERGRLERAGRGIFRLTHFPADPEGDLVPAWLWSERKGTFSHATALAQHQLSDALPASVHMTLSKAEARRRRTLPPGYVVTYADLPPSDIVRMGLVPVTTPFRTVKDCVEAGLSPEWVQQAITEGLARGLFTRKQLSGLSLPPSVTVPARRAA